MSKVVGVDRVPEQRDRLFENALAPRLRDLFQISPLQGRTVKEAIWRFLDKIPDPQIQQGVRSDLAWRVLPARSSSLTGVDHLRALQNYEQSLRVKAVTFDGTPIFA